MKPEVAVQRQTVIDLGIWTGPGDGNTTTCLYKMNIIKIAQEIPVLVILFIPEVSFLGDVLWWAGLRLCELFGWA